MSGQSSYQMSSQHPKAQSAGSQSPQQPINPKRAKSAVNHHYKTAFDNPKLQPVDVMRDYDHSAQGHPVKGHPAGPVASTKRTSVSPFKHKSSGLQPNSSILSKYITSKQEGNLPTSKTSRLHKSPSNDSQVCGSRAVLHPRES